MAFVKTMSLHMSAVMGHLVSDAGGSTSVFDVPPWEDFLAGMEAIKDDLEYVPRSETVARIFGAFLPLTGTYLKDVSAAKMLLSVIFEDFSVDKDIKLGHDALKEGVLQELSSLESSLKKNVEFCESFHNYRAEKSLESKLNYPTDDLKLSLWVVENQVAAEAESTMLQMVMGYFQMIEVIRETYDLLQFPGLIGHRKTHVSKLRNNLYG